MARREAFLASLRGRLGCLWAATTTGEQFDCLGLAVWALVDCGFLGQFHDPNLSAYPLEQRARRMLRLLHDHSAPVEKTGCLQTADIALFKWSDVNLLQRNAHHVGVISDITPGTMGSFIHCLSIGHGGSGAVSEVPLDALEWERVSHLWRLDWELEGNR